MIKLTENTLTPKEWRFLRKKIGWTVHGCKDFSIAIQNSLHIVSAYVDNELVGMARITGDNRLFFFIQDVMVLPAYQNMGIGNELLTSLLKYIKKNAAPNAIVNLMASMGKEGFYEKRGFKKRTGNPKGYGMELVIYPS